MKEFGFLGLKVTIFLSLGIYLADTQSALERSKLEKKFTELHPRMNKIIWKELENLKPDSLEKVCNRVLSQLTDDSDENVNNLQYVPVDEKKLENERIIKNAAVQFQSGLQYTLHMPVVKCVYQETMLYLCHGNDTHVFRLNSDPFQGCFTFRSGLHEVEWN